MNSFNDMSVYSGRKTGRTGHKIADAKAIKSSFAHAQFANHKSLAEKQQALLKIGVSKNAAPRIAKVMKSWNENSFYQAVLNLADGPGKKLGIVSRSFQDGVLTACEARRIFKKESKTHRDVRMNSKASKKTEDAEMTYEYTRKAVSKYVSQMRKQPGVNIDRLMRFGSEAHAALKRYKQETAKQNDASLYQESLHRLDAEIDRISDKYGLSKTTKF